MKEGYLPLYRKYRPQKLSDIVGQSHIKRALTNAIELNKIAHAYLFTGPRGTGKTSTARILAKSLNCVNGPTTTPCEECESCKAITNTIPIDVIEIDAASNRSVDDAHEILEKVNYAPVHGKYKIYIIDEVHMLTTPAFNALLKTLEEPPKNVIFILATTESHKVLDTIKSRCQRFDFKRITTSDIVQHLKEIAQKEGINITDGAISLIAKSSAGGMRDSLALLDQVSTIGNNNEITEDDINNLLGRLSFNSLAELSKFIINSDSISAISYLEKIYNDGNEPLQILTNLMLFFKNMLIIKTCNKSSAEELTGLTKEQVEHLVKTVSNLEVHQLIFLINKSADYIKELKDTTNQQMWLEVGIIDLSNLTDNTKLVDLEARIARLEGGDVSHLQKNIAPLNVTPTIVNPAPSLNVDTVQNNQIEQQKSEQDIIVEDKELETPDVNSDTIKPEPLDLSQFKDLDALWMKILQVLLNGNISGLAKMKAMTSLVKCDETGIVVIGKTPTFANNLNIPEKRKKLSEAIYSVIGRSDINIIIRPKEEGDAKISKVKIVQPKPAVVPNVVNEETYETNEEELLKNEFIENNSALQQNKSEDNTLSEQSNMVKNLFDGKLLD